MLQEEQTPMEIEKVSYITKRALHVYSPVVRIHGKVWAVSHTHSDGSVVMRL